MNEALATTRSTVVQIKAEVQLIQQVLSEIMIKDVHYGTIPGTPKPTLYKPGSEKILRTFHIGVDPSENVQDLSTDDEIRYRVFARAFNQDMGNTLGVGVGECSSNEEKYKWRRPVCDEEFDETPEDRRRLVWKKGQKPYQIKQVRTNPADVANTILKMAKKRAQIDMTLTVTAASDVFEQDLEDLPEEIRDEVTREKGNGKPPMQPPQEKKGMKDPDGPASEPQIKAISTMWGKLGIEDSMKYAYCTEAAGLTEVIKSTKDLTKAQASSVIEKLNKDIEEKKAVEG